MNRRITLVRAVIALCVVVGVSACSSFPPGHKRSVLELERQGTRVIGDTTVELYMTLNADLNAADTKVFYDDPEAVIRRLLEEQGQKVNQVVMPAQPRAMATSFYVSMFKKTCFHHVQIPLAQRSRWIVVVVDTPYC